MNISDISKTAILLLICRAVESERRNSDLQDPMAVLALERLISIAPKEEKSWIIRHKRMYAGIHSRDSRAGVLRGRIFDQSVHRFISTNPKCTVINLACGFDTRYWRINTEKCKYIEIDLPEVIALKREILKDHLDYELIGCSVLDSAWMDQVTSNGNTDFLLLAEGLFMWLSKQDATWLLQGIALRFDRSQLVLEMVPEKYTKGIWKSLLRFHSRLDWGLDVAWEFGIKNPGDIESYGNSLKMIGEEKGSVGPIITVSINTIHMK
jgi:O-methyltransferase involved in polyketide biosynthesis